MCCSRHTAAFGFAERSGDRMLTLPAIVEEILGQSSRRPQAVARGLPGVPESVSLGELRSTRHARLGPHAPATDVRIVLFTSGTTAAPKAVVHDERSIGASMELLRDQLQLTAGDVVFSSELYLNVPALMAGARNGLAV